MYYSLEGPDLLPRAQSENSCHEENEMNEGERMLSLQLFDDVSVPFSMLTLGTRDSFMPMSTNMFL